MKFDKTLFLTMIMILATTSKLTVKKRARPIIPPFGKPGQERNGKELYIFLKRQIHEICEFTDEKIYKIEMQKEFAEMNYLLMAKLVFLTKGITVYNNTHLLGEISTLIKNIKYYVTKIKSAHFEKYKQNKVIKEKKMEKNGYNKYNCNYYLDKLKKIDFNVISSDLEFKIKQEYEQKYEMPLEYYNDVEIIQKELNSIQTVNIDNSKIFAKTKQILDNLSGIYRKLHNFTLVVQIPAIEYEFQAIDSGKKPECVYYHRDRILMDVYNHIPYTKKEIYRTIFNYMICNMSEDKSHCYIKPKELHLSFDEAKKTIICGYFHIDGFYKTFEKNLAQVFVNALATYLKEVEHLDEESYYSYMNRFIDERAYRFGGL